MNIWRLGVLTAAVVVISISAIAQVERSKVGGSEVSGSMVGGAVVESSVVENSVVVGSKVTPPNASAVVDLQPVDQAFKLAEHCPPSFELTAKGCELRSLYQFYDSVQNRGVGGTQTSLPANRDGFSPQQIDLGRFLFFDPLLSGDGSQSCASCHQPDKGFADGKALSVGATGEIGTRSAPTLWNSAFLTRLFWDGRATSFEEQAQGPLYAANEMNNNPVQLLASLNGNEHYPAMFDQAFGVAGDISLDQIYTALAAFQSSLISLNSRYDQYAHGNHQALNEREVAGLNVFRSFVARCSECHQPPLFTNNQIAVIGTPEPEGMPLDIGAEATFNSAKLKGGFKVPTLRNIAQTAPYMHSGVFDNLRDATEFYTKGRGHAVPEGVEMNLHWHIWEPDLADHELDLIVDFMKTLTDETAKPQVPSQLPSGLAQPISSTAADHFVPEVQAVRDSNDRDLKQTKS